MKKEVILVVDNDRAFRETCVALLNEVGYETREASSEENARTILEAGGIDLALIDVRLEDDDNINDRSGVELATDQKFNFIPKIILTSIDLDNDTSSKVLSLPSRGLPPVTRIISKPKVMKEFARTVREGLDSIKLTPEVENAAQPIRAWTEETLAHWHQLKEALGPKLPNLDLSIQFAEVQSFTSLARKIYSVANANQAEELERLLRLLFRKNSQIAIDTLPHASQPGLVTAWVSGSRDGYRWEPRLLKIGTLAWQQAELNGYERAKQYDLVDNFCIVREQEEHSEHFGCVLYKAPRSVRFHEMTWLTAYYTIQRAEEACQSIDDLLAAATRYLYKHECKPQRGMQLENTYIERLNFGDSALLEEQFQQTIAELAEQGFGSILLQGREIQYFLDDGELRIESNPIDFLFSRGIPVESPAIAQRHSIGISDISSILVDKLGNTWLTNFCGFGPAPCMFDFVALEAAIRFNWLDVDEL